VDARAHRERGARARRALRHARHHRARAPAGERRGSSPRSASSRSCRTTWWPASARRSTRRATRTC
jgi:hypothetical protein